jgi:hypothetical protein
MKGASAGWSEDNQERWKWLLDHEVQRSCSVNFLFFELSCEILCERNLLLIVFRKLEVVRY